MGKTLLQLALTICEVAWLSSPRTPPFFEEIVRDNLGPHNVHDDADLWRVLGEYAPCSVVIHALILFLHNTLALRITSRSWMANTMPKSKRKVCVLQFAKFH